MSTKTWLIAFKIINLYVRYQSGPGQLYILEHELDGEITELSHYLLVGTTQKLAILLGIISIKPSVKMLVGVFGHDKFKSGIIFTVRRSDPSKINLLELYRAVDEIKGRNQTKFNLVVCIESNNF